MRLQTTLQGDRVQIAILGRRNAGKSSLMNALTGQQIAIVSETRGTTTDPVTKAMEILPLGPCMLIDTPGIDDEGELGQKRVEKAYQALRKADIAVLVIDITQVTDAVIQAGRGFGEQEEALIRLLEEKALPYLVVLNKADRIAAAEAERIRMELMRRNPDMSVYAVSSVCKTGLEECKDALAAQLPSSDRDLHIIGDLVEPGDMVILVVPIDSSAPKGRLIMPQQQVIRDLLDHHAVSVVTQISALSGVLEQLQGKVKMVITDSQAFREVDALVPEKIPLTSFSILFARHKGNLAKLVAGVAAVRRLQDGDKILIAEGCTHHRQCEDIGTVKIPRLLQKITEKKLQIETCSGVEFPADLSAYAMVIHCGGCTLHEKEMKHRIYRAEEQGIPIVNYGIFLAYANDILQRSVELFPAVQKLLP